MGKWLENVINEIGEKIDLYETETNLVKNVVPKPEECGEPSRRNTHFLRLSTFQQDVQTILPSGLSQGKPRPMKKLALPQLGKLDIS